MIKTVLDHNRQDFDEQVNKLITDGWKIISLHTTATGTSFIAFMLKEN